MPPVSVEKAYVFESEERIEINDTVYPGDPFRIEGYSYKFRLNPKSSYWRFGLRFSKTPEVGFSKSQRHHNPDFPDIQFACGDVVNPGDWSNPNKLQFGQYHFPGEHELSVSNTYVELGFIELSVECDESSNELHLNYIGEGVISHKHKMPIGENEYFQLFAWSDWTPYKIECLITIIRIEDDSSFSSGNIVFHRGDLFQSELLKENDILILPVSNNATTKPNIKRKANELDFPQAAKLKSGEVYIFSLGANHIPKFGGWAYSVDGEEASTEAIITSICLQIVEKVKNYPIKSIALPLLGTGAGNMDILTVAELYSKLFNELVTGLIFNVYINVEERYQQLQNHFNSENLRVTNDSYFSNRSLEIRDKQIDPVLNVKDLAEELADIANKMPQNEQEGMIGIFGKWGRGKTFLMNEIWKQLEKSKEFQRVDFHVWKYQNTPGVWAYLFEQFANKFYNGAKNSVGNFWRRLRLNISRLGSWKLFSTLIPIAFSLGIGIFLSFWEKLYILGSLISFGFLSVLFVYYRYRKSARNLIIEYNNRVSFTKVLGVQAEVQKELRSLLKTWTKEFKAKRVFLFVEDIDRCSEDKIIEMVDSLRVMVEDKEISMHLVIIAAIDESILQRAITHKYERLIENGPERNEKLNQLTREYLDKLFLIGIRLGSLSDREKDEYLKALSEKDRGQFEVRPFNFDDIIYEYQQEGEHILPSETLPSILNAKIEGKSLIIDKLSISEPDISVGIISDSKKISEKEYEILRDCVKNSNHNTPRQVRIFYYRYLLTKNLLSKQYSRINRVNVWNREDFFKLLMSALQFYSDKGKRESLSLDRLEALRLRVPMATLKFSNRKIDTLDYRELLKALDVVIAY